MWNQSCCRIKIWFQVGAGLRPGCNFCRAPVFNERGRLLGVLFGTHAGFQARYVLTLHPHEKARASEPSLILCAGFQPVCLFVSNCHAGDSGETSNGPRRFNW
jgi:hypothetical protein